jgi:type IV pilus assembly protein PilC
MSNFAGSIYSTNDDPNQGIIQKLHSIQIGGNTRAVRTRKRDLIFILRNIAILVENGLSLPRALETLLTERALRRYTGMLQDIKQRVENGDAFSDALSQYPQSFNDLMVSQIRIGERSGTIPATVTRIMHQLEHADNLKGQIIKKLSYPILLVTAGSAAVTFMLLYVVPTFENVYKESGAKLPAITQLLIDVGRIGTTYGWMFLLALIGLISATVAVRRKQAGRLWMDAWLLRLPLLGQWFRNIAILQFMEVLGNLMEAGFTVVEALKSAVEGVGNHAVRARIQQMHEAVTRGERFSEELEGHRDLFPSVVTQLVGVGEKTGTLSKTTTHIRAHLRREVETYTNVLIGIIEPVATISLAAAIGCILLAIYLPMFDMINAMNAGG